MPSITITMDESDFVQLWTVHTAWSGAGWRDHAGPFEAVGAGTVEYHWEQAYWTGDNWPAVMLLRSFLASIGHDCQVVVDTTDDPAYHGYVVLTDYLDPTAAG
ncbi:hypothetical protein SAMN05421854_110196 [Amycolatopsis rubida]|uniref:Uncharacterized protein n=2 Tax=Amycolatopsis rubida TaxID=112413 RepID=A0A1I5XFE8_9PSEU|nr:hypothetical protein SAMN05421854_110196 [Amycolatopsis rubida]